MKKEKVTIVVCRSCIRENEQSDATLSTEATMRKTYEQKMKAGLFGKVAKLKFVDCLTNCGNPNSVQIERGEGTLLFGKISRADLVDQVIALGKQLRRSEAPLAPSKPLEPYLVYQKSKSVWRPGDEPIRADRVELDA